MEAEIAELRQATDYEVHADCWEAVGLFLACETQWRMVAGMGGAVWCGLDYSAVEAVMRMRRVPPHSRAALLVDVQRMERAALAALAERRPAPAPEKVN